MLEEWRTGLIYPMHKRDRSDVKNYRGITLLNTAYKIYASILNDMLVKELEGKLGEEQLGFSKGKGTIDAIYILNHIVNRELTIRRRKVFVFFADLKAA